MYASQLIGYMLVMTGLASLVLRRDDVDVVVASDSTLLLLGLTSILVGGLMLLLTSLKKSLDH